MKKKYFQKMPNCTVKKKMKDRRIEIWTDLKRKHETLTRYIKNWAVSANVELCCSQLTLCGLTGLSLRNAQLFIYPNVGHKHKKDTTIESII
ncbi:MAG: hypothetical protein ACD_79C01536G0010 [uncultured bacterium]|nr:MAG: hypothetical protein ACD_79C01536G0010 [uncultured bacterium]HBY02310.1 hypothetical protein [Rikenellaceae bacterium]